MKRIAFGSAEAPPPPSKIVAVGRNYREHAKELGHVAPEEEPILFLKAPSALLLNGGDIVLPPESARVDYEGELALVVHAGGFRRKHDVASIQQKRRRRLQEQDRLLLRSDVAELFGVLAVIASHGHDLRRRRRRFRRSEGDTFHLRLIPSRPPRSTPPKKSPGRPRSTRLR